MGHQWVVLALSGCLESDSRATINLQKEKNEDWRHRRLWTTLRLSVCFGFYFQRRRFHINGVERRLQREEGKERVGQKNGTSSEADQCRTDRHLRAFLHVKHQHRQFSSHYLNYYLLIHFIRLHFPLFLCISLSPPPHIYIYLSISYLSIYIDRSIRHPIIESTS